MTDFDLRSLIVTPRVRLKAVTLFLHDEEEGWESDAIGAEAVAEFAGRACYQSWGKPNSATATNAGYLRHIVEAEHLSVFEHGQATIYFTGVSRGFTHELVRHRHESYSQLSQRYVNQAALDGERFRYGVVIPPAYRGDLVKQARVLGSAWEDLATYSALVEQDVREGVERGVPEFKMRKKAREAARSVLPNCVETRIVVTGNLRAWRELIAKRATVHADAEMREVTVMVAKLLKAEFSSAFQDMRFSMDVDTQIETVEFVDLSA